MNIFSNIGITELIIVLLLALLVVGPERLPELGRKLGKTLRDVRNAYENLTRDLGPELTNLQKSTQELRESVESVRSIPQDMVQTVIQAADLEETVEDLKQMTNSFEEVGQTLSAAGKTIKDPMGAAVDAARSTLDPRKPEKPAETGQELPEETVDSGAADSGAADSGAADSGAADSGAADSGAADSGAADSGAADSGVADSGAADSGVADSGAADSGVASSGPEPGDVAQSTAVEEQRSAADENLAEVAVNE